jgi:hypothetical protein
MAATEHTLSPTAWTDCGTAPCFLQLLTMGPIAFRVDGSAPSDAVTVGARLPQGPDAVTDANITLTGTLYVRSLSSSTADRIVVLRA